MKIFIISVFIYLLIMVSSIILISIPLIMLVVISKNLKLIIDRVYLFLTSKPVIIFITIGTLIGILIMIKSCIPKSTKNTLYTFSDFFETSDNKYEKEFKSIKNALKLPLNPNARCPCGSGNVYIKCHSPKTFSGKNNWWKGPSSSSQDIILGYTEKFDGIELKDKEILVLKGENKISIARYFKMRKEILLNRAIIRKLFVEEREDNLIFSGSIEIESNESEEVSIIIGSSNMDSVVSFEINQGTYEEGRWFGFIGNNLKNAFEWYRYFISHGNKIIIETNKQLKFTMTAKKCKSNIFTLSLPFEEIELTCPKVSVASLFSNISLELEREKISWNLIFNSVMFSETQMKPKDLLSFKGVTQKSVTSKTKYKRKTINGPRKIRICLESSEK